MKILQFLKWMGVVISPIGIIINLVLNGLNIWEFANNTIWIWTAIGLAIFFGCTISLVYSQHKRLIKLENAGIHENTLVNNVNGVIADSSKKQNMTQEYITARLLFIQQLQATHEQLAKNIHFNIQESVAHFFNRFCEEPEIREIMKNDEMVTIIVRLIKERYQTLTYQSLELKNRGNKLKASTITDENIRDECNGIKQNVYEYRKLVDEWMNFIQAISTKVNIRFWEKNPWSTNIHRKLADSYDELMALVKDLRNKTPREFQSLLPIDEQITKFPRVPLWG